MKQEIQSWNMIKSGVAYPCSVPCSYYDVLMQNDLMEDPYYRDNEKNVAKMYGDDCRFEAEWIVDGELLSKKHQILVFEGLDTLCDIYLNGRLIATTNNMHRTWRFDVKELLREGSNSLAVEIHSAVTYFKEQQRLHPMKGNGDTLPGFAHIRKAFYMSGWDWGPTLPDMGIWRPVYLLAYDAKIEEVEVRQKHLPDGSVLVTCKTAIDGDSSLHTESVITDSAGKTYVGTVRNGIDEILIQDAKLWWPNGYGEQNLYTVTVKLLQEDKEIDRVTKTIGLRTLTISQDKDQWGKEFCFMVNGVKIFSMGANYIPEENILPRRSKEKTEYLIRRCVEANCNTLRVWGGGIYPDDWFYDLCDRYGLIVWQDFMFACNIIWLTDEMEKTIKAELTDNIKRIRHHASLGLLCGNNENEQFMVSYMKSATMDLEKADYLQLYCHIIPDLCAKYAPDTFYWSSSPSSGTPLFNYADDNVGDRHIWSVWGALKEIEQYQGCFTRFCSEFGFQSFPDMETVEKITLPEDRNMFSEVMERHQKNKNGNGKLMYYMAQYYTYPTELEKIIYATQLLQARAVGTAVEHFRRNRGRCMGAIYWQLNDCWQVASWASIDYEGRPKALYYHSKKFFAPLLLSANIEEKSVILNLSSELKAPFIGTVVWRLKDTSFHTLWEKQEAVKIAPLSATDIVTFARAEIPSELTRDTFLEYELHSETGELISRRNALFVKPKQFRFPNPDLHCKVQKTGDGKFRLEVSGTAFARNVKISFADLGIGEISDAYFDITSSNPISLEVITEDPNVTEAEVAASIRFLSEADLV